MRVTKLVLALAVLAMAGAGTVTAQQKFTDPGLVPTGPFPAVNNHSSLGTLTFYPNRASFQAAHPGLAIEDFTGTLVAGHDAVSCPSPLDDSTNDACFLAGSVIPGFQFDVVDDGGWETHYAIVNNALGLRCVGIGPNFFVNETDWNFSPAVAAVAMDIYTPLDLHETFNVEIFGPAGSLGAVPFVTGGTAAVFIGVDTVDPGGITSIEVREVVDGRGEVFCDLEFGDPPVPVVLQSVDVE